MKESLGKSVIDLIQTIGPATVRGSDAVREIKAFLKKAGCTKGDLRAAFEAPDHALGPFDGLPDETQRALAAAAHFHIQEMNLLTTSTTRILSYGPPAALCGYLVHKGWKLKNGRFPRMSEFVIRQGRRILSVSGRLSRRVLELFRFTGFYRAPFPHMLWSYTQVDPWPLIQNYVKRIPVDPRLSPVYRCVRQATTSCGLVGIDLLPSRGKLCFLESNFNPGHYIDRHRLFPEGDTLCNHLIDWAIAQKHTKIVFFPHNVQALFDRDVEDAWRRMAETKGIHLEVIDDPIIGSPWQRQRRFLMDWNVPGLLYINGRHLRGPLARLIAEKGLLDSEIRRFNSAVAEEARIPIPTVIRSDQDIPSMKDDSVFPNIIVKNAVLDQTKGISLYKSDHLPAEFYGWPNIAYEYLIPDLETKEEDGTLQKYVSIFRAYLLITPDGPVYLGARKDISSVSIPPVLSIGRVVDVSPYITNLYMGAYSVPHTTEEDQRCREVVCAIGNVVYDFLREKHVLHFSQE